MIVRAIDLFGRVTRAHALLLTCTCVALLLFNPLSQRSAWPAFGWANSSTANEDEIDAALQQAAETALGRRDGAIIVMDAQTGRVRAAVNPEAAYAQAMMPGSSIKPFTTLAALRAGVIDEDSRTVCPGRFTGLSFSLPCTHADHLPPFNPSQAIAYSCNYYFATLGQRLGRDKLVETLRQFGFGQQSGIAVSEAAGIVKPCETGDTARMRSAASDRASQHADCAAREAIGESDYIQVTPIQLLSAYAALLNGGHLFQPQTASAQSLQASEKASVNVSPEERHIIVEGMSGAIRYGTARHANLDSLPLTIIGKTGTAQPPKGFRTNGWFAGFAGPPDATRELAPSDVQLAVIVFLPRANGAEAAKVSRPIFEAYANAYQKPDRQGGPRKEDSTASNPRDSISSQSATGNPPSSIKVHLVRDNVTRELSLEDYVLGVMRAEGTMETQPEALKALAIAIRTYALKNSGRHAKDGYDFCSTTHCQRFVGGDPTVREGAGTLTYARVSDAVRATAGQVLLDERGQLLDSYFGASCGGETANVATLWGTTPADYLHGVRDEFCESGPHAHWTDVISRSDLLRALQSDSRTDVGQRLDQVVITTRDDTGRAEFITLEGESRRVVVRGWDFKIIVGRVLGWNVLKSSRFEVSRSGSNFIFRGSGFGHGLGLCQEGAHVMAARGASYQRILEKYFPGTSVRRDSETRRRDERRDAETRRRGVGGNEMSESGWKLDVLAKSVFDSVSPHPPISASSAAQSPRFLTISSEHFRVTYPADTDRREANQVLSILENARADYLRRASAASLSVGGLPLLQIRINDSTGNFVGRTGQPWWAAAATKGRSIELQPIAILKRRGVLNATLKHELAHVIIDIVSRDRAPRWLEEGFAIYLAGEGAMYSRARRSALSDEELEKRLEHPRSQGDMRASYADAYARINEMVRNGGEASVWTKLASY